MLTMLPRALQPPALRADPEKPYPRFASLQLRRRIGPVWAHLGTAGSGEQPEGPQAWPRQPVGQAAGPQPGPASPAPGAEAGGWAAQTSSNDWADDDVRPAQPQQTIQEPPTTGTVLLLALIVGLSAAAWQLSRFIVGYQEQRASARQAAADTLVREQGKRDASTSSSARAGISQRSEDAQAGSSQEPVSRLEQRRQRLRQQRARIEAENASASKKDDEDKADTSVKADVSTDAAGKSTKAADSQQVQPSSAAEEQRPVPEPPSSREKSAATDSTAPSGGLESSSPASGAGTSDTASPSTAKAEQDVPPVASMLPVFSQMALTKPEAEGVVQADSAGVQRVGDAPSGRDREAPPATEGKAERFLRLAAEPAEPAGPAPAAERPQASQASAAAGDAASRPSVEALTVPVPSASAADQLPPGRSLLALRERAHLALRAAAAASEASQRAAACSASASAAASQAADAAERAAAAATQAQSALESEAEGAIAAAEQRAQQAAGFARQAQERAAHAATSAVAYQDLAQGQASVAAKAARVPSDGSGSRSREQWSGPLEFRDEAPRAPLVKSLHDVWHSLLGQGEHQQGETGGLGKWPGSAGGGGSGLSNQGGGLPSGRGSVPVANPSPPSSGSQGSSESVAARTGQEGGNGQAMFAGALGKASSAVKGFVQTLVSNLGPPMEG